MHVFDCPGGVHHLGAEPLGELGGPEPVVPVAVGDEDVRQVLPGGLDPVADDVDRLVPPEFVEALGLSGDVKDPDSNKVLRSMMATQGYQSQTVRIVRPTEGMAPAEAGKAIKRATGAAAGSAASIAAASVSGRKSRANPAKTAASSAAGSIATDIAGPLAGRFVRNLIGGLMR